MARNKFDVDERLETEFNLEYLKRVFKYVKPYKKDVFIAVLIMLIASVSSLLGPYIFKYTIDSIIPSKNIKGLILICIAFILTIFISSLCLKFKIRITNRIGQNVIYDIRQDLFKHLQELPFSYYDSRPHGKILVRVVNYINGLSDLLSNGIINTLTDLFTLSVIIVFMFSLNTKLTIICLLGLPLLIGAIFLIKNAQRKAWQTLSSKTSNLNAYIHESICGIKVTQSFSREETNFKIFNRLNNQYRSSWMRAVKIQFLMGPIVDNISTLIISLIYIIGISLMNPNATTGLTVGVLIAFIGYISRFWAPISNLANTYNSIINAMAYLERIFETMDEKPTIRNLPNATDIGRISGNVEFKNVSFQYDENTKVLNNVSFKVKRGQTIALVGPTGAGKSTIINLISRFYDVTSGKILIDNKDIRYVTLHSLRSQMGIMLQDSFIFSGTILENIRYGDLNASYEKIIECSKAVMADNFIRTLPNGYNTVINEKGSNLSIGQKQLISFARTMLSNPRILILDEATSSIDTETEVLLQKGLERLLKGRTSFIIAHRLSTIKNADTIMYIDNGRIIESGTHEELMRRKGAYYELYESQYKFLKAI